MHGSLSRTCVSHSNSEQLHFNINLFNRYDLLCEEREKVSLPVREHQTDGFFVEGCRMITCTSAKAAYKSISTAFKTRQTGSHDLNSRSNRSHFITEIHIDLNGQAILNSIY